MDIWFWIVVVLGAAVIAMVIVGARRARQRVDPTQITIDPALAAQIKALLAKGDKLKAVKVLREATGLGLGDAVRIVEKMTPQKKTPGEKAPSATPVVLSKSAHADIGPDHLDELRSLVGAGQQIQAIKMVRELTGMGLKDAKEFVDRL